MHVSAMEEYGLRCALQLARHAGQGALAASQLAEKEGISVEYVSKLLYMLRKAGLVKATRGVQGGFSLGVAPESVSLKDIMDAIRNTDRATEDFCCNYSGRQTSCVHLGNCSVRPVWKVLTSYYDGVLKDLTLKDLLTAERGTQTKVEDVAARRAHDVKNKILGMGLTTPETPLEANP